MKKLLLISVLALSTIAAKIPAETSHFIVKAKKENKYIEEGVFIGGVATVTQAKLKDVRRGPQSGGGERIVFDMEMNGKTADVPYFQLNVDGEKPKLVLSFWTNLNYDYDDGKVRKAFQKSKKISALKIFPRVEEGLATIEILLNKDGKEKPKVEAFYLTHPARVIIDVL